MVDVTPTCVSRYSRRGLGRHGHHPSEITGRKRLEEHLAAVPLTTRLLAPNGRAFDEALDPSAPPASFAQQQLPGAEILAGREEALVHRSEEHTSELKSLMRISYAVFCLKKKKYVLRNNHHINHYKSVLNNT